MASGWAWAFCFLLCVQIIGASSPFPVGGAKGWHIPSGSESYSEWAGKIRFHINDTLLFKYDKKVDSVLQVSHKNHDICNTTSPIKSFKDGNTLFKLEVHGPFYFISGNSSNCNQGEKLIVVVMSPCHNNSLGGNCRNSSIPSKSPSPSPRISPSPSPSTIHSFPPSPTSFSPSPSPSPSAESPQTITPSSSSKITSPAPSPLQSASSSSATSLANLVIPVLLVALLNPNL